MPPRHHNVVESTIFRIYSVLPIVSGIVVVRILHEILFSKSQINFTKWPIETKNH
ncbi:hypothetical protein HanIR_Chr13g0659551 [Helianthus annuus]|nr:hypothetical protein HanIR_Chr13g0659551 [Helianthus annuus]